MGKDTKDAREKKLISILDNSTDYIYNPEEYIKKLYPDVDDDELVDLLRLTHSYNLRTVHDLIVTVKAKQKMVKEAEVLFDFDDEDEEYEETVETPVEEKEEVEIISTEEIQEPKLDTSYADSILQSNDLLTELENRIETFSKDEIIYLKLQLKLKKNMIINSIRRKIILNPSTSIKEEQDELENLELATLILSDKEQTTEVSQEEAKTLSRIVIVPNKNSSYLYDDISQYNNKKEIKNTFDKIVDGYFLKTKNLKSLESFEKLCEYTHPNGIRILYVVDDGIIYICSLFYKDKQVSKKITNYYDEANRRYLAQKDYIKENLQTPDFIIEQEEIIGNIYGLLETGRKLKKGGDING